MMGVSLGDARAMTWWEFNAMRHVWVERHATDEDRAVELPNAERVRAEMIRINGVDPISQAVH